MPDKEWSAANVLDVFGDPIARATLVLACDQPVTVKDLAGHLDVSGPTIYRRIDSLVDANLLRKHQPVDEKGNQPSEYETLLDEVTFDVDADGYTIEIEVRDDIAGDFESLWSDLEQMSHQVDSTTNTRRTRARERDPDLS